MSETTLYAHGIRADGETDDAAAQRIAREHICADARNARVTQARAARVIVAAEVDALGLLAVQHGAGWAAPCGHTIIAGEQCAHGWSAPRARVGATSD